MRTHPALAASPPSLRATPAASAADAFAALLAGGTAGPRASAALPDTAVAAPRADHGAGTGGAPVSATSIPGLTRGAVAPTVDAPPGSIAAAASTRPNAAPPAPAASGPAAPGPAVEPTAPSATRSTAPAEEDASGAPPPPGAIAHPDHAPASGEAMFGLAAAPAAPATPSPRATASSSPGAGPTTAETRPRARAGGREAAGVGADATTPPRATAPADAARPPAAASATGSAPPAPAPVAAEPGVDARSLATAAAGASATTVPPPAAEALRAAAAPRSGKASPASPSGPVDGAAKTAVSAVREAARGVETLVAGAPPAVEPGLATPATARHGGVSIGLARGDAPASSPAEAGVDEVPAQIRRVAESGGRQLHVRLVPADLGRLDIRLDFDGEHGLKVQIRADNDQALDLLQRQGHQLERALQQSGFEVGRDAVRYELDTGGGRSARGGGGGAEGGGRGDGTPHPAGAEPDDGPADGAPEAPERGVEIRNVLDLHV